MKMLSMMCRSMLHQNYKLPQRMYHQMQRITRSLVRSTTLHLPNLSPLAWFVCCTTWEISFGITLVLPVTAACSLTESVAKNCRSGKLRSVTVRAITRILQIIRRWSNKKETVSHPSPWVQICCSAFTIAWQ